MPSALNDRRGRGAQPNAPDAFQPVIPAGLRSHTADTPGDRRSAQRLKRPADPGRCLAPGQSACDGGRMTRRAPEADGRTYWGSRPDELAAHCAEHAATHGFRLVLQPDTPVVPDERFPFDA